MQVYVLGSVNLDLTISTERQPLKGETILGRNFKISLGGKGANQAVAASFYDANVSFMGVLANDQFGLFLIDELKKYNVDTKYVKKINTCHSNIAMITKCKNDNSTIVSCEANETITEEDVQTFLEFAKEGDIFLTQLELPIRVVEYAIRVAKDKKMTVILNPAPAIDEVLDFISLVDYLIPNEIELKSLTGIINIEKASKLLPSVNTIVTLGSEGVYYYDEDLRFPAIDPYKAIDTTGAGDCFIGAFTAMLSFGQNAINAVDFARGAASLSTQTFGTTEALKTKEEVLKAIGS